jgi:7-carboxy-7-deazaguanine synthase
VPRAPEDAMQTTVDVCEVFRSLQGETTRAGRPATFIRLAGCNLRCRYCDTAYARQPGTPRTVASLVASVERPELVVVTGGEPLLQSGTPTLLEALVRAGHRVLLETNGSLDISGLPPEVVRVVDVKCPGSGEAEQNRWDNLEQLRATDEVKLVITDRADFDFALEVVDRYGLEARCPVLLSPAAGRCAPATLAAWLLARGGALRLQLQLHRILWPDQDRGV